MLPFKNCPAREATLLLFHRKQECHKHLSKQEIPLAIVDLQTTNLIYMSNIKTTLDEWEVQDLEDNSSLHIYVQSATELGNKSLPGIQVMYMGHFLTYEPLAVERWAYQADKAGKTEYLLENNSWMVYEDQYIKNYLILGTPLKAKVEVKTRTSKPKIREYALPFKLEND
jgi:hypothetical protein